MTHDTVTLELDSWFALGLADFLDHHRDLVMGSAEVGDTCPHDSEDEFDNILTQLRSQ